MRLHRIITVIVSLFPAAVFCQQSTDSLARPWSFSTTGFFYFLPEDADLPALTATADYKEKLHLELRYNYESRHAVSVFAGRTWKAGNKLSFSVTPMVGLLAGSSNGFIPAFELGLNYKKFEFYSETEYVIDFAGPENNYLYSWTELGFTPFSTFLFGISAQRTRVYQASFDIQPGPMVKYGFGKFLAGAYWFNPLSTSDVVVISLGIEF